MARIQYVDIVESASGKLCKHGTTIFMRNKATGKNYTSRICKPNTNPPSADQLAMQETFRQTAAKVKTAMKDEAQLTSFKELFEKQTKYATLRGFIFAQLYGQE